MGSELHYIKRRHNKRKKYAFSLYPTTGKVQKYFLINFNNFYYRAILAVPEGPELLTQGS